MNVCKIDLKEEYPFLQGGTLECIYDDVPLDVDDGSWQRPAVLVVPGGGYRFVSRREGGPIANAFMALGFQVFILTYLTAADGICYPEQLLETAAAMDFIRKNAKKWRVNEKEVFAVGFSAGGHLVANLSVEYDKIEEKAGVSLDCKPLAVGLSYPVINHRWSADQGGTYDNLLQGYTEEAKAELMKDLNLDERVTETTPPAFIWATASDGLVPAQNSLDYAMALSCKKVDFELHVYPKGSHGLSTASLEICEPCDALQKVKGWVEDCAQFFRQYTEEKF